MRRANADFLLQLYMHYGSHYLLYCWCALWEKLIRYAAVKETAFLKQLGRKKTKHSAVRDRVFDRYVMGSRYF